MPPSTENIRGEITQWDIWDTYIEDFKKEAKEDEKGNEKQISHQPHKKQQPEAAGRYSPSFLRCMKIMERMIRQN